jgi:GTPase Era involved in 16S rRNA processing
LSDLTGVDTVLMGIEAYVLGLKASVQAAAEEIAELLQEYAKANHPWTVRSGDTNRETTGVVAEVTNEHVLILLRAGMPYDSFLELLKSGKWAWLHPAIEAREHPRHS